MFLDVKELAVRKLSLRKSYAPGRRPSFSTARRSELAASWKRSWSWLVRDASSR